VQVVRPAVADVADDDVAAIDVDHLGRAAHAAADVQAPAADVQRQVRDDLQAPQALVQAPAADVQRQVREVVREVAGDRPAAER
jgi:hypothetical protein